MQLPFFTNKHFKLREILHAFKNFPVCYTITTIPYNTFYAVVLYINFLFFHFSKKPVKQTKKVKKAKSLQKKDIKEQNHFKKKENL